MLNESETIQPRHSCVGNDEMEIVWVLFHPRDRCTAIGGHFHNVSGGLQRFGKHVEDKHIVIGTKDTQWLPRLYHRKAL